MPKKRTTKVAEQGLDQNPGPEPTPEEVKAEIKEGQKRLLELSRKQQEDGGGRAKFLEMAERLGDFYLEEAEREQPWETRPPSSGPTRPARGRR